MPEFAPIPFPETMHQFYIILRGLKENGCMFIDEYTIIGFYGGRIWTISEPEESCFEVSSDGFHYVF